MLNYDFYDKYGFSLVKNIFNSPTELDYLYNEYKKNNIEINEKNILSANVLDLANKYSSAQNLVSDNRILSNVKKCLSHKEIKFLKWSLFQINHMSFPWHRDGPNRKFGIGQDWNESEEKYDVLKVLIYLKCENFALAVYPKSHNKMVDRTKISNTRKDFFEISDTTINEIPQQTPVLIHVQPGDMIIFNQRLLHCGKIFNKTNGDFTKKIEGEKGFLTFLYGSDNKHSHRMFSYFEYEREFNLKPYNKNFEKSLKDNNLYPSFGTINYFNNYPLERKEIFSVEKKNIFKKFIDHIIS